MLPGLPPVRGDHILIPLQGQIRRRRSFQAASPVRMIAAAASTGRPCIATLHPSVAYDDKDRDALRALMQVHPNLSVGEPAWRGCVTAPSW